MSFCVVAVIVSSLLTGCPLSEDKYNSNTAASSSPPPASNNKAIDNSLAVPAKSSSPEPKKSALPADKSACVTAKMDGKKLIASQTFAFDFEPFRGSCFVTFASKDDMLDDKDVPRGSTFHIFRDGKKVFDFPDAFAGTQACWIEAVGFEDLNSDGRTDVVIAGSCLSARDSYPQNAIFANRGDSFTTDETANELLNEARTVREIKAIAKKNIGRFF